MRGRTKKITSPSKVIRTAVYCRQSVADDLDFSSTDSQSQSIHAYIESQKDKGWSALPQDYVDHGYSGGTLNRPAFQKLMQDVKDHQVDVIVIHKIDRISRSLSDFVKIHDFFEQHGVALVATSQLFDTSTPVGRMTINLLATFADFEREMIRERTREKMGATRKKGMWTGGRPVLGYYLEDKQLKVNEEEANQVRAIYQLYLERGSLLAVAVELNRRGWTTKTHMFKNGKHDGGRAFDKPSVQRVLASSLYAGKVEYQGEQYEGAHEAIVDEETWKAVQTLLESHRCDRGRATRNKWSALLMGLVRCHCGSALTHHYVSKGGKRFHYYVCEKTLKKGAAACPKSRIAMRKLENAVVEKIRTIGQDSGLLKETAAALKREREEQLPELRHEARHLEKDQKRLREGRKELLCALDQENGDHDSMEQLAELNNRFKIISIRLEEVMGDIETLKSRSSDEGDLRTALRAFGPIWEQLFPREKARILNLLIASVVFNGQDQTVEIRFRPNGITTLAAEFEEEAAA